MAANRTHELAIVTGASTGIGLELARCCALHGYDLLLVADEEQVLTEAANLRAHGTNVEALVVNLATPKGVSAVVNAVGDRRVGALLANAGRGLGHAFLDQKIEDILDVINLNVSGTLLLIHEIGRKMRRDSRGKILVTGSIAGLTPGPFQAVYNGTKALLDSFSYALREELKGSGVSVTCLLPGGTDTAFFERAGLTDTKEAVSEKQSASEVAKAGFDAMIAGEASVIPGLANKFLAALTHLIPSTALAEQSRTLNEPGTAKD